MAISDGLIKLSTFAGQNPISSTLGAAGAGIAIGSLSTLAITGIANKRKSKRRKYSYSRKGRSRIKHSKRGLIQDRKRRSKQKWEVAYQKRKRRHSSRGSKRGIKYTKNGQPYKIMSNGRARFIKRKGGKR